MDELAHGVFDEEWRVGTAQRFLGRPDCQCLGAWWHEKLIGYVIALKLGAERDIVSIGVSGTHRRLGVARALLDALAATVGVQIIHLEVKASNTAAIELYRAAGYASNGRRNRYYPDGSDALLFRKDFP